MKKVYQEPEVEFVSMVPQDVITNHADGETGVESSIW